MNTLGFIQLVNETLRRIIGIACIGAFLFLADSVAFAQDDQEPAPPIPAGELDSLVAPIALYPDTLLAQTLAASTYPLEVMQLDQWMKKNANLKDKALADAVAKQPWDPSVQAMAAFPDVVTRMGENIQWMTDIGNAFLEQQKDVMDAVQRMRAKAQGTGNLKTSSEAKVETKTTQGGEQVVVIEQSNPQSVYVPSYDPQVVYGAPPPEYPYYPYSYPGYQPGTALAWGTSIALGAAWANNNWGNCNWDDANININNNNNFNKNSTKNVNRSGQANGWQHNPQHRGNAPYGNKQTANKYGGTARGESRTANASARGGAGTSARTAGGGDFRAGSANAGGGNRAGGAGGQARDTGNRSGGGERAGGAGDRAGGGGAAANNRGAGGGHGGGNNVGNRGVSSGSGGNAFGGGGSSGASARAASSRGGSSMKAGGGGGGGRGGGGASRGGGGGGRGGGGGGRRR